MAHNLLVIKKGQKNKVPFSIALDKELAREIDEVVVSLDDRNRSWLSERFIRRGLAAYRRDGLLDEPANSSKQSQVKKQPQIGVLDMDIADRKAKKKQGVH